MDLTKLTDRFNRIWQSLKTPPPPQTSATAVAAADNANSAAISTASSVGSNDHHQSPAAEEVVGGDLRATGGDKAAESDMSAAATASKLVKSAYPKQQMIQLHSNQPYNVPGAQFSLPLGSPAPPPPPVPPPHLPLNISGGGGGGQNSGTSTPSPHHFHQGQHSNSTTPSPAYPGSGGGGNASSTTTTTNTSSATSSAFSSQTASPAHQHLQHYPLHYPHLTLQHQSSAAAAIIGGGGGGDGGGLPPHAPLTGVSSSSGGSTSFPHYQGQQGHSQHSILVNSSSQPIMTNQNQHQHQHSRSATHHYHSTSTSSVTSPHNPFSVLAGQGSTSTASSNSPVSAVVSPTPPTPSSSSASSSHYPQHHPPPSLQHHPQSAAHYQSSHHSHHHHSHHHPSQQPPLSAGAASLPPLAPSHGSSSFSAAQTPESPSLSSSGFRRQLSLNIFQRDRHLGKSGGGGGQGGSFGAGSGGASAGGGGGGGSFQPDFSGRRERPSFSGVPFSGQSGQNSSSLVGSPLFGGAANDSNLIDYHSLSPRPRPKNLGLSNSHDNISKNVSLFSNNNNSSGNSQAGGGSPFGGLNFGSSRQHQQQHRSGIPAFNFNSPLGGGGGGGANSGAGGGGGMINHARSQIFYPNPSSSRLKEEFASKNNRTIKINGKQYENIKEDDFQRLSELGSGSFGVVDKMLHKPSKTDLAVKKMRRSGNQDDNKHIINDLELLRKCIDFKNIVQCYGYYIMETEVWIFMELMTTCFDRLLKRMGKEQRVPEQIIGKIVVATVSTLDYLKVHHGVIHRDIKPSNILINRQGVIKLCDFGISGRLIDSKAHSRSVGCAAYMAPERIQPPDSTGSYDIRSDVWSLGITLVEIATGRFPYQDFKSDFELLSKVIQEEPPTLSTDAGFSPDIKNFIDKCLTKDYNKRPKYKELMTTKFYLDYLEKPVDVAEWFRSAYDESDSSTRTSTSSLASSGQVNHF